jgi:hypothetical protein
MRETVLLFFVLTCSGLAQPIGIGIKAGVPLTDALSLKPSTTLQYLQDTHRYTVGPYVEVHLPAHLVIEIDALYRSYEFQRVLPTLSKQPVSSWEFPVLGKYKLFGGPIQPYIEGGVAFSRLTDIPDIVELSHRNNYGVVIGGGVELHVGKLRITPEVRYNGWVYRGLESPLGQLQSNRNQAAILVGFGF